MRKKLPDLDHVKYVRSKGKVYAYFNTGQKKEGRPIYTRLPDPAGLGFMDSYVAMLGARTKRHKISYTVADMARDYERSVKFASNAVNTQILYSKTLRQIVRYLGEAEVGELESHDIQSVIDTDLTGPGARKIFLILLSVLYKWGRDNKKTDAEPTKGMERAKGGRHEPWPDEFVEAALATDDDLVRLAVHLLYFTGQRIGDVVKMRWSDIRDGVIHVVQQKTGKELWIPHLNELRVELARTPKRGLTILARPDGKPERDDMLRKRLQAFTMALGKKTVPHGLRKNAVEAFLEAGCSVAEAGSITGQSYQVVEYYAKRINQKRMAHAAVLKLENKRGLRKPDGKPDAETA